MHEFETQKMLDLKEVPTKPTILPLNGNADSYALKKHSGLSLWAAAVFVGGNMAGSGVLALPRAVANAGPIGIALIAVFCIASGYLGTRLAMCWVIIEERYPEYKKGVRDPYPTIGFHAFGQFGRILVSITNTISLFGVSIVFLILCSDILTALVRSLLPGYTICTWLLVITLLLIPLSWIGSPKEFTWAGIAALVTTVIASVLSIIQAAIDAPTVSPPPEYPAPGFLSFFLAFGAILFSFGGASTFPTIQIDMKDKTKFPKAVAIAFVGLMLIYFPMATTGYYVYGDSVDSNILNNLSQGPMTVAAQVLIGAHVFSAFIIIFNPVCQELEKALKVPSGQKGLVARGEVHLGSAGNWATDIAEEYRDFIYPHLVDGVKFAVPPPTRKPYWYAFVLPFRYAAWIAIGLCIIFGGLVNWIIAKLCFLPINNKTNPWKDIWFSATYNFGALVARTMPTDHSPAPARLFNLSRILAYFFITAAFTSSIISYLSVPIPEDPIDSIKRVAESDLTISGIPDYYDLYINSVDPYMVQSLQRYNKTDENFDQFAYVNARLGACIDSERILSYYTQVIYKDRFNNPTIHIVKQDIAMAQNVALAPKNSIYTDAFSNISIRLFGSGLHQFWTKEAVLIAKKKYESFQPDLYEEKKFNLKSFQAPFIAWLFMLVVSITVFIFERCYPDYNLG